MKSSDAGWFVELNGGKAVIFLMGYRKIRATRISRCDCLEKYAPVVLLKLLQGIMHEFQHLKERTQLFAQYCFPPKELKFIARQLV